MKSTIVALASALLLAVAITELSQRIWPDSHLALLVLSFFALLLNGLFNARQSAAVPATGNAQAPGKRASGRNAGKSRNQNNRGDRRSEPQRGRDQQKSRDTRGERKPSKQAQAAASEVADGPREEGTVKWFNRSKGFGFVVRANGEEIFVHQRSIRSEQGKGRPVLKDGETVSFVVAERERGMQAEDVVPVGAG
ncbi:MAG: cold shock domain-containing protein [Pseudomonadales bacterium]